MSRRARRSVVERLHRRQRSWLLGGQDLEYLGPELGRGGPGGLAGFESEADAREAWMRHRAELIAEWLEREPYRSPDGLEMRGGPGTRPWAWWRFEAEAPRHVSTDPRRQSELRSLGWGMEATWRASFGRAWGPYLDVETELALLRRLGLLLEAEEAALAGATGPQPVD